MQGMTKTKKKKKHENKEHGKTQHETSRSKNHKQAHQDTKYLRFKYTTKFSLPKIACPAIVYAEIVVVIDLFFVGVCP